MLLVGMVRMDMVVGMMMDMVVAFPSSSSNRKMKRKKRRWNTSIMKQK